MPDIINVVDFLERNGELALGESPWASWTENDELHPLDWDWLFGGNGNDIPVYFNDPPGDLLERVRAALAAPPTPDEKLPDTDRRLPLRPPHGWPLDGVAGAVACAWYQPIHFFGTDFGIFIRLEPVFDVMVGVAHFLPAGTPLTSLLLLQLMRAGVYGFFLHEQYHHKIESLAIRLHVTGRIGRYRPYMSSIYGACLGTDDQIEEALANADSFLRLTESTYTKKLGVSVRDAFRRFLRWRFPIDPPGYRKAINYLTDGQFDQGENLMQGRVNEALMTPVHPLVDWCAAPHLTRGLFTITNHVWWVVPKGSTTRIPGRTMPVRSASTKQMVKLCEHHGYSLVPNGGKGSHKKLKKPNSPMIIIPGDRDMLSPNVARNTLRALGNYNLADLPQLFIRFGL